MAIFVAYLCVVSLIYNTMLVPNPLMTWAPGLIFYLPLIVFSVFDLFEVSIDEVAGGFIAAATFCVFLAMLDQVSNMAALDQFVRVSAFDSGLRRLVLAKTEQAFSVVLLVALFFRTRSFLVKAIVVPCGLALLYVLVVLTESRLVLGASGIGLVIYVSYHLRSQFKVVVLIAIAAAAVVALPFVMEKYAAVFQNIDLLNSDASVQFRNLEQRFFAGYFDNTYGLGFGFMHLNENLDNIQSFAMFRAGQLFGAVNYPVSLGDIGIYGALYQFGYLGLAFTIVLTVIVIVDLMRAGRDVNNPSHAACGAFGSVALAFMLSPLPMNYFTLDWTVAFGGTLWYVAARSHEFRLRRRMPMRSGTVPAHANSIEKGC
ncbi:hypothetical protein [Siculibacillus lacustris]|nr:hypothetical protein [Siculibacillus lacustris]